MSEHIGMATQGPLSLPAEYFTTQKCGYCKRGRYAYMDGLDKLPVCTCCGRQGAFFYPHFAKEVCNKSELWDPEELHTVCNELLKRLRSGIRRKRYSDLRARLRATRALAVERSRGQSA